MAAPMSVSDLVDAGIEALARGNVVELEKLIDAAHSASVPQRGEERNVARLKLRALRHLLILTQRNLRLLRGFGRGAYGPAISRSCRPGSIR